MITRWLRKLRGYRDCPKCGQQTVKFVKDVLLFDDEPPMLAHWECENPDCRARTETESLPWADKIAKEHGYETFKEAIQHTVKKP